tara:strand:- start:14 stop:259 length:246 start_codon:yes stop_codon:yes gene_type:complete
MGYGYAPTKATIITNTAAHTGRFVKIMALENSVIASMTTVAITENGSSTVEGININTSACIEGLEVTSITLTSGTVIAYEA